MVFNTQAFLAIILILIQVSLKARNKKTYLNYDHFDKQKRVVKKEVKDLEENLLHTIHYFYEGDEKRPYSFNITDKNNEYIKSYNQKAPWPYIGIPQYNHFNVMLIDSGVDHNHPQISSKLFYNDKESSNEFDDDQNGLIDDYMGWSFPKRLTLPVEPINTKKTFLPLSHGTHVAGIMMKEIEAVGLVPYTGDYGEPEFLKLVNARLRRNDISFVNMSFSLPHWSTQDITKATYNELRNIIKDNQKTLFITSSGNDGKRLAKNPKLRFGYPALYNLSNIIVVGALDTNNFDESKAYKYNKANYSNYDNINVDIFAPGTKISAPSLGGGEIIHSGTSMATPWVLNHMAKVKIAYPSITHEQLKYALLFSAYIPDLYSPMKCSSGGMIFPRRFMELAGLYIQKNILDRNSMVEEAIALQKNSHYVLKETLKKRDEEQLRKIWKDRVK